MLAAVLVLVPAGFASLDEPCHNSQTWPRQCGLTCSSNGTMAPFDLCAPFSISTGYWTVLGVTMMTLISYLLITVPDSIKEAKELRRRRRDRRRRVTSPPASPSAAAQADTMQIVKDLLRVHGFHSDPDVETDDMGNGHVTEDRESPEDRGIFTKGGGTHSEDEAGASVAISGVDATDPAATALAGGGCAVEYDI
mmetsp:Transcript_28263/g.74140  ORF Transcript_28263/g.74140 Transcript_28263/m.74140 type:complete len:195 (+) Transcript_28263:2502-3086(+)